MSTPDSTNGLLAKFYLFLVQWLSVQEKFTILEDDVKDANEPNIDDDQINERTAKTEDKLNNEGNL